LKICIIQNKSILSKDIISSTINQLWRIIAGPGMLLVIPFFISPEIQGFWYTFGSISALSVFADLGFTTIVCQFAAHEFAFLSFDDKFRINGPTKYCERLSSLFRFILKWTILMICIVFPLIFLVGYCLFIQKATIGVWLLPWLLYSIGAAITFINGVIASFIQGCGQVANVQKICLRQGIFSTLIILLCLMLKFNLYSLAFGIMLSNIFYTVSLLLMYKTFLIDLLEQHKICNNWGRDILGLLWKYAISWTSGYFVFQIYTPLMFHFHGAVEAGKVGITMSLVSAIFNISNTWFSANTPKINMFVAKKDWMSLDKEFKLDLKLAVVTYLLGIGTLVGLILILEGRWAFFDRLMSRFLGIVPLGTLILCWFFQIFVNGMAIYLRAHKQEPYVLPSFVSGLFILMTTFICLMYLPPVFLFLGFFLSFSFGFPWCYAIFKNKRREWHYYTIT